MTADHVVVVAYLVCWRVVPALVVISVFNIAAEVVIRRFVVGRPRRHLTVLERESRSVALVTWLLVPISAYGAGVFLSLGADVLMTDLRQLDDLAAYTAAVQVGGGVFSFPRRGFTWIAAGAFALEAVALLALLRQRRSRGRGAWRQADEWGVLWQTVRQARGRGRQALPAGWRAEVLLAVRLLQRRQRRFIARQEQALGLVGVNPSWRHGRSWGLTLRTAGGRRHRLRVRAQLAWGARRPGHVVVCVLLVLCAVVVLGAPATPGFPLTVPALYPVLVLAFAAALAALHVRVSLIAHAAAGAERRWYHGEIREALRSTGEGGPAGPQEVLKVGRWTLLKG